MYVIALPLMSTGSTSRLKHVCSITHLLIFSTGGKKRRNPVVVVEIYCMETQICKYCGEEKLLKQFPTVKDKRGKVYRRKKCYTCRNIRKTARRKEITGWFEELKKSLKCERCGDARHYILEFHHDDPSTKEKNLSDMVRSGWGKDNILKEVEKCITLCANCHRELHWEQK